MPLCVSFLQVFFSEVSEVFCSSCLLLSSVSKNCHLLKKVSKQMILIITFADKSW